MRATLKGYGSYSSGNYGVHALALTLREEGRGAVTVYFSYETAVAVDGPVHGLTVHKIDWGKTTGKHLNWINRDHSGRVTAGVFADRLADELAAVGATVADLPVTV